MRGTQQVAQLDYVQTMGLEIGDHGRLLGRETSCGLLEATAKIGAPRRDLDHQPHALADAVGFRGTEAGVNTR